VFPEEPTRLRLSVRVEDWRLTLPFRITGHLFTSSQVLVVELSNGDATGRGEAAGVYYRNDTPHRAAASVEALRPAIEAGISRLELSRLLPAGGARNALDCALWDLQAQRTGQPVWALAGLAPLSRLVTAFTIGADTPAAMAAAARTCAIAHTIKLKLIGDGADAARVGAVRVARPDVTLLVDANQGFTPATLDALWPALLDFGVALVEQPYPVGRESWLEGAARPIPVAADESVQSLADMDMLAGRFDVVNIKLDKCGGLSEALAMASRARALGLRVMVGNMMGTSLSMAPAFVLGQLCDFVDLDGPTFLARDRVPGVKYEAGCITICTPFWGNLQIQETGCSNVLNRTTMAQDG
jgi:L-alanine-DL-glutamate epimerase-like enolase superfamily enzyme